MSGLGKVKPAAERQATIEELIGAARADRDRLVARIAELEATAHAARVAVDFDAADQAQAEAERLATDLPRAQSRLAGLEAAQREISTQRQRDAWQARLAELQALANEQFAECQRHIADFRPALSAARMSARAAMQCEQLAREAMWEAGQIKVSLGLQDSQQAYRASIPRPATVAAERDRYWRDILNDGTL